MAVVVAGDRVDGRGGLIEGGKAEQPAAGWKRVAEAGVLRDDRPPGREIRGAAIAEPAGAEADVLILGDGELTARAADVVAVSIDIGGQRFRVDDVPAVRLEQRA